jgi:hypothetical protein
MYICHGLRPRTDFHARPLRRFRAAPAILTAKAPSIIFISRLNVMASVPAVYACDHVPPLLTTTQDSLRDIALVVSLYRAGVVTHVPRGFDEEFQRST